MGHLLPPVYREYLIQQIREDAQRMQAQCPHGDPCCPCQDGDACHYETYGDSPAWPCTHCKARA
jgi:hypothetical protein